MRTFKLANERRPRSLLCVDARNVLLHKRYRKRYKAVRWLLSLKGVLAFYSCPFLYQVLFQELLSLF